MGVSQFQPLAEPFLVGDPFEVLTISPIVVLSCKCREKQTTPISIHSINSVVACVHCHRLYFIDELAYSKKRNSMFLKIGYDSSAMGGQDAKIAKS